MIVDISDWESDDWHTTMDLMERWIAIEFGDVDAIWPDRKELLHFNDTSDAIEFIMRWA